MPITESPRVTPVRRRAWPAAGAICSCGISGGWWTY